MAISSAAFSANNDRRNWTFVCLCMKKIWLNLRLNVKLQFFSLKLHTVWSIPTEINLDWQRSMEDAIIQSSFNQRPSGADYQF